MRSFFLVGRAWPEEALTITVNGSFSTTWPHGILHSDPPQIHLPPKSQLPLPLMFSLESIFCKPWNAVYSRKRKELLPMCSHWIICRRHRLSCSSRVRRWRFHSDLAVGTRGFRGLGLLLSYRGLLIIGFMKKDTTTVPKLPRAWELSGLCQNCWGLGVVRVAKRATLCLCMFTKSRCTICSTSAKTFCLQTHASALQVEQIVVGQCSTKRWQR